MFDFIDILPIIDEQTCPQRLIDIHTYQLVFFADRKTLPKYTILSHRWIEGQEVTFQEFLNPTEKTKAKSGYKKIIDACNFTREHGGWKEGYIWIDTCCINKQDQDELSWNIASMAAFYRNATICYAYLFDIESAGPDMFTTLSASSYFTRGWTLQELIIPYQVLFIDRNWHQIGFKMQSNSPQKDLQAMTGLDSFSDEFSYPTPDLYNLLRTLGRRQTFIPED
ncbi:HET-domain-containing protein [Dendrothele bispora CBS 962.96]|uniref:HET-domain-containing protein n=1 Tax=Dendrothele bispora (strain CBS 962.96) TaxID=1314807 RepID=A0A4S8L1F5_DENBC|nr:HET-domain-containing protein [Dendrothele bispora CBS 962.96]